MNNIDFQNGFALGMASGGVVEVVSEELLATKQDILISGESIKTINGESLLGEGNLDTGEKWEKVAEVTATENVNSIYASFDSCKAVRVQFMFGAVGDDLGHIGIAPNCGETFYRSENRACAASITTSSNVTKGWGYIELDTRGSKLWTAKSAWRTRSDGGFSTEIGVSLHNTDIGFTNMQYSIMNHDYFSSRQLENGINSITAYGAGMVKGTTLYVWGIKK